MGSLDAYPLHTMRYWRDRFTPINQNSFVELTKPPEFEQGSIQMCKCSGVRLLYNNIQIELERDFDPEVLIKCMTLLKDLSC